MPGWNSSLPPARVFSRDSSGRLISYTGTTVICYLDAFSGLSGDMLVGAFADPGADRDAISRALAGLATGGTIEWDRVQRRGMSATKFRVSATEIGKHRHLSGILKMIHAAGLP